MDVNSSTSWLLLVLMVGHVCCYFHDFDLSEGYDKRILPKGTEGSNSPLSVWIQLHIMEILEVEESDNEISLDMWIHFSWYEERINLTKPLSPNRKYALDPDDASKFWTPVFYVSGMRKFTTRYGLTDMNYMLLFHDKRVEQRLRANVVVKCKFDFDLYPLDIQSCPMEFMSPVSRAEELRFRWTIENNKPLVSFKYPQDNVSELEAQQFDVDMHVCTNDFLIEHVSGNVSALRVWLIMDRQLAVHVLEVYLPAAMFVLMSWCSFLVKPEMVPGRMVLLVTNLLSLVTLFESSRMSAPPAKGVKCIDVWLLSCIMFVFFALLEYAVILYKERGQCVRKTPTSLKNLQLFVEATPENRRKCSEQTQPRSCLPRVRSKLRHLVWPLSKAFCRWRLDSTSWCLLDQISMFLFPLVFLAYNVVYWAVSLALRGVVLKSGGCAPNSVL